MRIRLLVIVAAIALFVSACTSENAITLAESHVGRTEANAESYMEGGFWCDEFIDWLMAANGVPLPRRTGSPSDFVHAYPHVTEPQRGDLAFQSFQGWPGQYDHVGIVVAIEGDFITTISGNIKLGESGEVGVGKTTQHIDEFNKFVRPPYPIDSN